MISRTSRGIDSSVATVLNAIENEDGPFQRDRITLHPAFLPILAEGRPAPAAELAAATGRSTDEMVWITERTAEMEVDRNNRVLGMAITLLPTAHRVQLPGRSHLLYA